VSVPPITPIIPIIISASSFAMIDGVEASIFSSRLPPSIFITLYSVMPVM